MIKYSKTIKLNSFGDDALEIKNFLFSKGYYSDKVGKITHNKIGIDSVEAIKNFQRVYDLEVDGKCGQITLSYINALMFIRDNSFKNITVDTLAKIFKDLQKTTEERANICLNALVECTEPKCAEQGVLPKSLYIRGGNLYNKDKKKNIITANKLKTYKKNYPTYCTKGRLDFMCMVVDKSDSVSGCDCSGAPVGIYRTLGILPKDFDANANSLLSTKYSKVILRANLKPADFCGKDGHIGIYVGGGYTAEWAGGEYGCQLSGNVNRKLWSYTDKRYEKLTSWGKWRRPKFYGS